MSSPLRLQRTCCQAGLRVLLCLFALVLLVGAQGASAQNFNGSIFTTFSDGTTVNGNIYPSKDQVYLDGGPQNKNANGLPDGFYYFQVTQPGPKFSDELLLSVDDITCRVVQVVGEVVKGVPGTGGTDSTAGGFGDPTCYHNNGSTNPANGSISVQLCAPTGCPAGGADFLDTGNPGGEYKVYLTPVAAYVGLNGACTHGNLVFGFCDGSSKTDNFKVKPQQCTTNCNNTWLTVCKFWDLNDNGIHDGSEPLLDGWTIHAVNVDGVGGTADQPTGDKNPGSGCTTFTITGFPDANTIETVTLTEVLQANWNETAPLAGTYPGGSAGSITVTGCSLVGTPAPVPTCAGGTISVPLKLGDNVLAPDFGNTGFDLSVSKTA